MAGRRALTAALAGALFPGFALAAFAPPDAAVAATPLLAAKVQAASASTWTTRQVPLPVNADHTFAQLYSVACPSASACTAVGSYTGSAGYQGLLLAKSGSLWTASQAPLPAGAAADPYTRLTSVACASASACVAGGTYNEPSGAVQGLLLTGSGGSWTAVVPPLPAGAASPPVFDPYTAACTSTSCLVGGFYVDQSGDTQGLLLTGSGSSWTAIEAPLPPGAATNPFAGIGAATCSTASKCTAVGTYSDTGGQLQGLLLAGSGSSWTATKAPVPANANTNNPIGALSSVACSSASRCTVVGSYTDQSYRTGGLLLTGSGTSWTATQAPLPANARPNESAGLNAVACPPAFPCAAVGSYISGTASPGQTGLLLTGSGSSWTPAESPLPGNANIDPESSLSSLACTSADTCVAIGSYQTASYNTRPMLVSGTGSSWSAIEAPLPRNGGASPPAYQLLQVACARKATTCVAVGTYPDQAGNNQALLLTGPP